MQRIVPTGELPPEIRDEAPLIEAGLLDEMEAFEEAARLAEAKDSDKGDRPDRPAARQH